MFDLEKLYLEVRTEKPPIWEEIHKHFKINDEQTIYTYGNILYNPADKDIDIFAMEHEKALACEQLSYEGGAKSWWDRYFIDSEFRQEQEFEAYWYQYKLFCEITKSIDKRFRYRFILAREFLRNTNNCEYTVMELSNLLKTNIHK